ncbi:MAG: hypothetical protein IJ680_07755 [Paludibacteraceae bacterium]|nr:hypothetical protein [Paludibacteraceae bacterium]
MTDSSTQGKATQMLTADSHTNTQAIAPTCAAKNATTHGMSAPDAVGRQAAGNSQLIGSRQIFIGRKSRT